MMAEVLSGDMGDDMVIRDLVEASSGGNETKVISSYKGRDV